MVVALTRLVRRRRGGDRRARPPRHRRVALTVGDDRSRPVLRLHPGAPEGRARSTATTRAGRRGRRTSSAWSVRTGGAHDLVVLTGVEPHLRWPRTFADAIVTVVERARLRGGRHRRRDGRGGPAHAAAAGRRQHRQRRAGPPRSALSAPTYQGITGLVGVLQERLDRAGIPAVSLRVGVPHYLGNAEHPLAVGRPAAAPRARARRAHWPRRRCTRQSTAGASLHDEAVAEDDQLRAYVRMLEQRVRPARRGRAAAGPTTSPPSSRRSSASRREERGPDDPRPGRPAGDARSPCRRRRWRSPSRTSPPCRRCLSSAAPCCACHCPNAVLAVGPELAVETRAADAEAERRQHLLQLARRGRHWPPGAASGWHRRTVAWGPSNILPSTRPPAAVRVDPGSAIDLGRRRAPAPVVGAAVDGVLVAAVAVVGAGRWWLVDRSAGRRRSLAPSMSATGDSRSWSAPRRRRRPLHAARTDACHRRMYVAARHRRRTLSPARRLSGAAGWHTRTRSGLGGGEPLVEVGEDVVDRLEADAAGARGPGRRRRPAAPRR